MNNKKRKWMSPSGFIFIFFVCAVPGRRVTKWIQKWNILHWNICLLYPCKYWLCKKLLKDHFSPHLIDHFLPVIWCETGMKQYTAENLCPFISVCLKTKKSGHVLWHVSGCCLWTTQPVIKYLYQVFCTMSSWMSFTLQQIV